MNDTGYIYVAEAADGGFLKVGHSADPYQRLASLSQGRDDLGKLPYPTTLIGRWYRSGTRDDEARLHYHLAPLRIPGTRECYHPDAMKSPAMLYARLQEWSTAPFVIARMTADAETGQLVSQAMRSFALRRKPEQCKGRARVPTPCPRCKVICDSARQARDHCRVARTKEKS